MSPLVELFTRFLLLSAMLAAIIIAIALLAQVFWYCWKHEPPLD